MSIKQEGPSAYFVQLPLQQFLKLSMHVVKLVRKITFNIGVPDSVSQIHFQKSSFTTYICILYITNFSKSFKIYKNKKIHINIKRQWLKRRQKDEVKKKSLKGEKNRWIKLIQNNKKSTSTFTEREKKHNDKQQINLKVQSIS